MSSSATKQMLPPDQDRTARLFTSRTPGEGPTTTNGKSLRRSKDGWRGWFICSVRTTWTYNSRCVPLCSVIERSDLTCSRFSKRHAVTSRLVGSACASPTQHSSPLRSSCAEGITTASTWYVALYRSVITENLNERYHTGGRLAIEGVNHPQVRPATQFHPLHDRGGTLDCAAALPARRADRG